MKMNEYTAYLTFYWTKERSLYLQLLIDNPGVIFEKLTVHVISKILRETMLLLYTTTTTTTTNSLSQDYTNLDDHISQTSIDIWYS